MAKQIRNSYSPLLGVCFYTAATIAYASLNGIALTVMPEEKMGMIVLLIITYVTDVAPLASNLTGAL